MKTLGRILIILLAFSIVMGVIYVAVNSTTSTVPAQGPRFDRGERPEFSDRERGEQFEGGAFGLLLGSMRNTVVIAIIVALIVVPKGWIQRRRRQPQINGA